MVMYRVLDSDGNLITNARIDISNEYVNGVVDIIIDSFEIFSREELVLILNLIEKRVDYGGGINQICEYIELYKKIEKIVYQNDCK